jgi:hypothetical protein
MRGRWAVPVIGGGMSGLAGGGRCWRRVGDGGGSEVGVGSWHRGRRSAQGGGVESKFLNEWCTVRGKEREGNRIVDKNFLNSSIIQVYLGCHVSPATYVVDFR